MKNLKKVSAIAIIILMTSLSLWAEANNPCQYSVSIIPGEIIIHPGDVTSIGAVARYNGSEPKYEWRIGDASIAQFIEESEGAGQIIGVSRGQTTCSCTFSFYCEKDETRHSKSASCTVKVVDLEDAILAGNVHSKFIIPTPGGSISGQVIHCLKGDTLNFKSTTTPGNTWVDQVEWGGSVTGTGQFKSKNFNSTGTFPLIKAKMIREVSSQEIIVSELEHLFIESLPTESIGSPGNVEGKTIEVATGNVLHFSAKTNPDDPEMAAKAEWDGLAASSTVALTSAADGKQRCRLGTTEKSVRIKAVQLTHIFLRGRPRENGPITVYQNEPLRLDGIVSPTSELDKKISWNDGVNGSIGNTCLVGTSVIGIKTVTATLGNRTLSVTVKVVARNPGDPYSYNDIDNPRDPNNPPSYPPAIPELPLIQSGTNGYRWILTGLSDQHEQGYRTLRLYYNIPSAEELARLREAVIVNTPEKIMAKLTVVNGDASCISLEGPSPWSEFELTCGSYLDSHIDVRIKAVKPGALTIKLEFTNWPGPKIEDPINIYVLFVDFAIDSDNNNGKGLPDRGAQEIEAEHNPSYALNAPKGKIIYETPYADVDLDGIYDWYDGQIEEGDSDPNRKTCNGLRFFPALLEIKGPIPPKSKILLSGGLYCGEWISSRIWRKDGDQSRINKGINSGGDRIELWEGIDQSISPENLGFTDGNETAVIYLDPKNIVQWEGQIYYGLLSSLSFEVILEEDGFSNEEPGYCPYDTVVTMHDSITISDRQNFAFDNTYDNGIKIDKFKSSCSVYGDAVTLHLSGEVNDALSQIVDASNLSKLFVLHKGIVMDEIPLIPQITNNRYGKQIIRNFTFDKSIQLPVINGDNEIEIVSNLNDFGDQVQYDFSYTIAQTNNINTSQEPSSENATLYIGLTGEYSDTKCDSIFIYGYGLPTGGVSLTEIDASSKIFISDDGYYMVEIPSIPADSPNTQDRLSCYISAGEMPGTFCDSIEIDLTSRRYAGNVSKAIFDGDPAPMFPDPIYAVSSFSPHLGVGNYFERPNQYIISIQGAYNVAIEYLLENKLIHHNGRPVKAEKVDNGLFWVTGFADSNSPPTTIAAASSNGVFATGDGDKPIPMVLTESIRMPTLANSLGGMPDRDLQTPSNGRLICGTKAYKGKINGTEMVIWLDMSVFSTSALKGKDDSKIKVTSSPSNISEKAISVEVDGVPDKVEVRFEFAIEKRKFLGFKQEGGKFEVVALAPTANSVGSSDFVCVQNGEQSFLSEYKWVNWPQGNPDWVWLNNIGDDGSIGEPGWVWNYYDLNWLISDRIPFWAMPTTQGSAEQGNRAHTMSLSQSLMSALGINEEKIEKDASTRSVFNAFLLEIQRGTICHWPVLSVSSEGASPSGITAGKRAFDWLVANRAKVYERGDNIDGRYLIGQVKSEYLRWPGIYDLGENLKHYNIEFFNQYTSRTQKAMYDAMRQTGWSIDQNASWEKSSSIVLSFAGQLSDPFMYMGVLTGGEGMKVPDLENQTWVAAATDLGFLIVDRLKIGAIAKKLKATIKIGAPKGSAIAAGVKFAESSTERVAKIIAAAKGGICFAADTKVKTLNGFKNIQDIKVGDYVWSRDDESGAEGSRMVTNTFVTHPSRLVNIYYQQMNGKNSLDVISGTFNHPIWSYDSLNFVPMGDLVIGDKLLLADFKIGTVCWIDRDSTTETYTTFNLTVDKWNTYFVSGISGIDYIWVHNNGTSPCVTAIEESMALFREKGAELFKYPPFKCLTASQKAIIVTGEKNVRRPKWPNSTIFQSVLPAPPQEGEWINKRFEYVFKNNAAAPLRGKSIVLKESGHPDFGDFILRIGGKKAECTIDLARIPKSILSSQDSKLIASAKKAARSKDFAEADKAFFAKFNKRRPEGYTWHHTEDILNGKGRLELVLSEAHEPFAHGGGRTIIDTLDTHSIPW